MKYIYIITIILMVSCQFSNDEKDLSQKVSQEYLHEKDSLFGKNINTLRVSLGRPIIPDDWIVVGGSDNTIKFAKSIPIYDAGKGLVLKVVYFDNVGLLKEKDTYYSGEIVYDEVEYSDQEKYISVIYSYEDEKIIDWYNQKCQECYDSIDSYDSYKVYHKAKDIPKKIEYVLGLWGIKSSKSSNIIEEPKVITDKFWLEQSHKSYVIFFNKDSIFFELEKIDSCLFLEDYGDIVIGTNRKVSIDNKKIKELNGYYNFNKTIIKLTDDSLILKDNLDKHLTLFLRTDFTKCDNDALSIIF